jgi:F-type H+-transporting ATPase subunit a
MNGVVISLASETIGHIGPFEIRNTMLMAWLAMLALGGLALAVRATGYRLLPGRFQTGVEIVIHSLYDLFASILHDDRLARRFFPMLATILVFIVCGNWMGILPGVGSITILGEHAGHEAMIPLFRSMNADVNMTLAIALVAMAAVQMYGMAELGIGHYSGKFLVAPWKNPIGTFVGFLEMISELSRVVSFTFRLFGNVFAGEVLLVVISYLVPYLAPVPFLGMELFVGLIQGLVFALLTTVFLKIAVTAHDTHHDAPPAAAAA